MVSTSSAKAEFRSLGLGICEGIWIQKLLNELKMINNQPVKLICDNQAAINIAKNPIRHDRTKHVKIDCHFILEKKRECATYLHLYSASNS